MPFLEVWSSDLEESNSIAISGTIQAMKNTSLRLPLVGNVKADIKEVSKMFESAEQVMELVSCHIGVFSRQADEINNIVSDITNIICTEISLMEVCRELMSDALKWQVMDQTQQTLNLTIYQFSIFLILICLNQL